MVLYSKRTQHGDLERVCDFCLNKYENERNLNVSKEFCLHDRIIQEVNILFIAVKLFKSQEGVVSAIGWPFNGIPVSLPTITEEVNNSKLKTKTMFIISTA